MPKGALLHAHLDATVDAAFLLQLALRFPVIHVRTAVAISVDTICSTLPELRPLPASEFTSLQSLTDPSYPGNEWVPLQLARQNFALGGPEGFDQWYLAAVTINPAEAYGTHNTVTKVSTFHQMFYVVFISSALKIWKKFSSTFGVTVASLQEILSS